VLQRYQALRLERANVMVQQSRAAERWYHLEDAEAVAARNERFRRTDQKLDGGFSAQQHWLYSYDADRAALGTDEEWPLGNWSG